MKLRRSARVMFNLMLADRVDDARKFADWFDINIVAKKQAKLEEAERERETLLNLVGLWKQ